MNKQTGRCWYCGSEDVELLRDGTNYCHECGTKWGTPRYQRVYRKHTQNPIPPPLNMSKMENWVVVMVGALIITLIIHLLIIPFFMIGDVDFLFNDSITTGWVGFFIEYAIVFILLLILTLAGIIR